MPRITARDPGAAQMICLNEDGDRFDTVAGFDTDEGWVEFFPVYEKVEGKHRRAMADRKTKELLRIRLHTSYEIRHRQTDELLHKVVWDEAGNKVQ
jgi:hypothetical protein